PSRITGGDFADPTAFQGLNHNCHILVESHSRAMSLLGWSACPFFDVFVMQHLHTPYNARSHFGTWRRVSAQVLASISATELPCVRTTEPRYMSLSSQVSHLRHMVEVRTLCMSTTLASTAALETHRRN